MVHQPAVWRRKEPATQGRAVALLKEGTEFDATGEWLGGKGVPPVTGGLANCISLFSSNLVHVDVVKGVSIFAKAPGAGMDLTQVAHYQGGAVGVWRRCRFDAWTVSSGHVTTSL